MFLKFMVETFKIWKWNPKDLMRIALPNDIQIRKVALRLGMQRKKAFIADLADFVQNVKLEFSKIDDVFWNVGRIFCGKFQPSCHYCIFENICKYAKARVNKDTQTLDRINSSLNDC